MSGGDPTPTDPRISMDTSFRLIGGDLWSYFATYQERNTRANILFNWIREGKLKLEKPMFFKLSEGREAHEFLERGSSACKVLLIPDDEFYDYCPFYWKTRSQFETYLPKASLRLELLILKRMARMKEKIDGGDIE